MKKFEIKSIKAKIIVKIFEILTSYLNEVQIFVDKNCLKILEKDSLDKTATFIKLDAKNFEKFSCNEESVFTINCKIFYNSIKSILKTDTITLNMESDEFLNIIVHNENKTTKFFTIPTLDVDKNFLKFDEMDMSYVVNIPSVEFHHIITDINRIGGTFLEITSVEKELIFSCDDSKAKVKIIMREDDDEKPDKNNTTFQKYSTEIVQGKFDLSNLLIFSKACKLGENMNIYLSNEKPLILEYFVADLGIIRFICVQQ